MQMQECGIKIWISLLTSSITDHNLGLNSFTRLLAYTSKPSKQRTRNIPKNRTISSLIQTIKIHSGLAISHPESQSKDSSEISEDGFKL